MFQLGVLGRVLAHRLAPDIVTNLGFQKAQVLDHFTDQRDLVVQELALPRKDFGDERCTPPSMIPIHGGLLLRRSQLHFSQIKIV